MDPENCKGGGTKFGMGGGGGGNSVDSDPLKLMLLLGSDCICRINDFHNSASSAILNVSSFLFSIINVLMSQALNTAHDGVGFGGFFPNIFIFLI